MGSLERPNSFAGTPEIYGASVKINDEIVNDFGRRGEDAAALVLATLTESPHTPMIDGVRFEAEVSNVYRGFGDDTAATEDTVDALRETILEFGNAHVPGAQDLYVPTYRTRYRKLLRGIMPGMFDTQAHTRAFEEAMVEDLREHDVPVQNPRQAIEIIRTAPRKLAALDLTDYSPRYQEVAYEDAITLDGRVVTLAKTGRIDYDRVRLPLDIRKRGGRAPQPRDRYKLEQRIIDLRTKKSKR